MGEDLMNITGKLKSASIDQRPQILTKLYENNLTYFLRAHPNIGNLLEQVSSPYEINITSDFLDVVDSRTGVSIFGEAGWEKLASSLGSWSHPHWHEFVSIHFNRYLDIFDHSQTINTFTDSLKQAFPKYQKLFTEKKIHLPATPGGKRFSNSVIFAGVFHGLHIAHFLERTDLNQIAFYEPDPEKFIVSCYFLDYEAIANQYGRLIIHVGRDLPNEFFSKLFVNAYVTGHVWVRVLASCTDKETELFLNKLNGLWHSQRMVWAPNDQYLDAIRWATENIKSGRCFLQQQPNLSDNLKIALVASGPSLSNDLQWLKENRSKLLIFAAHSAVRPLRSVGIVPDIQFCLDLYMTEKDFNRLDLDPDVPFLTDARANPDLLKSFNKVFLAAGEAISYPVNFKLLLAHTMPTTGNLIASFCRFLESDKLYLLGLDMGFKSRSKSHVAGSGYDDVKGLQERMAGSTILACSANFSGSEMLTNPYFNDARRWIEELFNNNKKQRVYNFSDGAFICGTQPKRSSEVSLPDYPEKEQDLNSIFAAFQPAQEPGDCWEPFEGNMGDVLNDVQSKIKQALLPERMTRLEFARTLDSVLFDIMVDRANKHPRDRRYQPYTDILRDVFVAWYKFCVFAENEDEFTFLYQTGKKLVIDILAQLRNPES